MTGLTAPKGGAGEIHDSLSCNPCALQNATQRLRDPCAPSVQGGEDSSKPTSSGVKTHKTHTTHPNPHAGS